MKKIIILLILFSSFDGIFAQNLGNEMFALSKIKDGFKSKREGSYDRTGGNDDRLTNIQDGEKITILELEGAGIINRIWITIAPLADQLNRNDIILRVYWDGNLYPSVESPIGPFFGNGWGESYNFVSAPLAVAPTGGRAYTSYFSMPFSDGAKIEIENQSRTEIRAFYFNIDYVELEKLPEDCGRFHAWYNHEITDAPADGENEWGTLGKVGKNIDGAGNYMVADIKGKGHFIGLNYYVSCPTPIYYGEGDEMVFIDGEDLPSVVGTGTEDFFNSSWCPKEIFYHPYFGYSRVNDQIGWLGRTHMYRFLITDPIYFDESCKFTFEHGHNNNLTLDLASVAYWYQKNAAQLPRSFNKEERKPMPDIGPRDIHLWRDAWRKAKGSDSKLWGNERN